jgi:hypothetical protein
MKLCLFPSNQGRYVSLPPSYSSMAKGALETMKLRNHRLMGVEGKDTDTCLPCSLSITSTKGRGRCDGTSQVIRPTYSCPCLTDIRHPVDVPESLDKFGIFPYLTRNDLPVLQTLQNIGDKELRKRLHNLHLFKKQAQVVLLQIRTKSEC